MSANPELIAAREAEHLVAQDNERLRKLIKEAEWEGCVGRDSDRACPWCGQEHAGIHIDCDAFLPNGEVR